MSNGSPPYAAYRAVNTVRTVALDKCPGVRPLGIGEVWMRLWSDCCHMKTKAAATTACGNTQLCAGLRSGIEANLHAVRAIWPQSAGWTKEGASEEEDDGDPSSDTTLRRCIRAEGVLTPGTDPGAAEDAAFSRYEPGPASALRSLTPATASMSSTATSCCGTWPTVGIGGADSPSTGTGTGFDASSGRNLANPRS